MTAFRFQSITDVAPHAHGFEEWEFGPAASFDGYCDYVWAHHTEYDSAEYDEDPDAQLADMMRDYLHSVGEDPAGYSL